MDLIVLKCRVNTLIDSALKTEMEEKKYELDYKTEKKSEMLSLSWVQSVSSLPTQYLN